MHAQKKNEEDAETIQTLEKQLNAKRQKIQTLEADLALSAARQDAAVNAGKLEVMQQMMSMPKVPTSGRKERSDSSAREP